ncbi:hypothetical protein [Henriciella sp.]|uniref:hypothetical protein n=1 Tax=Henriciella sp. TaxID=1968823 RepID=UPI0026039272|nr:hypothetical protein [Henriciella sp.]
MGMHSGAIVVASALLFSIFGKAHADILQMECGMSSGHVYTAPEGLYADNPEVAGWGKDGIPNGMSIFELDTDTGDIAYRWKHFSGSWHSAEAEGTEPILVSLDKEDFSWQIVTLFNDGDVVEVCTFAEVLEDDPKALCTTSKNGLLTSARVFVSACKTTIVPADWVRSD